MPEENASYNIRESPQQETAIKTGSESAAYESIPPKCASDDPAEKKAESLKELEQDIRSGEKWLIGVGVASVLVNILIAYVYFGQLTQMRAATVAASDNAKTAKDTLGEIRKGGTDTHDLAVAASNQAVAMQQELALQREIAAIDRGFANIRLVAIAIYHEGNDVGADIVMENIGNRPAREIAVSGRVEFSDSIPDMTTDSSFKNAAANPNHLGARNPNKPETATLTELLRTQTRTRKNIYVFGRIQFADYRGIVEKQGFCGYIPADSGLNSPPGFPPKKVGAFFKVPTMKNCYGQ